MCLKEKKVFSGKNRIEEVLQSIKPGCAIAFDRKAYQHFTIYVGCGYLSESENGETFIKGKDGNSPFHHFICHLTKSDVYGKGIVAVEDILAVAMDSDIHVYTCDCPAKKRENAIEEALGALGRTEYSLSENNCEHFVRRILEKRSWSRQWTMTGRKLKDLSLVWKSSCSSTSGFRLPPEANIFLLRHPVPSTIQLSKLDNRQMDLHKLAFAMLSKENSESVRDFKILTQELQPVPFAVSEEGSTLSAPEFQSRQSNQEKTSKSYKVTAPKGVCLVININRYDESTGLQSRTGSEVDVDRVESLFGKLGYKVVVVTDLKAHETNKKLHDIATDSSNEELGSFVCFVMAHGTKQSIFGSDGQQLELSRITQTFQHNVCPGLRGKPKIFFVQSCRGQTQDICRPAAIDSHGREQVPSCDSKESDFLVCFASAGESPAYRDEELGSVFVQTLCSKIEAHHQSKDINEILTLVNRKMQKTRFSAPGGEACTVSQSTCTLTKRCYL